jgi:hypothetical protein
MIHLRTLTSYDVVCQRVYVLYSTCFVHMIRCTSKNVFYIVHILYIILYVPAKLSHVKVKQYYIFIALNIIFHSVYILMKYECKKLNFGYQCHLIPWLSLNQTLEAKIKTRSETSMSLIV